MSMQKQKQVSEFCDFEVAISCCTAKVSPYSDGLLKIFLATQARLSPTQLSLEKPALDWLEERGFKYTKTEVEGGIYRLRMMVANLVVQHSKGRPIPREYRRHFVAMWNVLDTLAEESDHNSDDDASKIPSKSPTTTAMVISSDEDEDEWEPMNEADLLGDWLQKEKVTKFRLNIKSPSAPPLSRNK